MLREQDHAIRRVRRIVVLMMVIVSLEHIPRPRHDIPHGTVNDPHSPTAACLSPDRLHIGLRDLDAIARHGIVQVQPPSVGADLRDRPELDARPESLTDAFAE